MSSKPIAADPIGKILVSRKGWALAVMGDAFQGMGEAARPGMGSVITSRTH